MKTNWLATDFGVNFVGLGIAATLISAPVIVLQDVVSLTPMSSTLLSGRDAFVLLLAAISTVFAVANIFILRPWLPKYVAGVLAITYASYVFQPLLHLQAHQLRWVCVGRILVLCSLLLFVWRPATTAD